MDGSHVTGATAETETGGIPSFTTDDVFDTLSSRRRRYVLHALKRADGPVTLRDLSLQLAAWENDLDVEAVRPKQRKRLYTALHQTHLPKMADMGVIEYDRNRGVVSLASDVDQFDVYFDIVDAGPGHRHRAYLLLGAILTPLVVAGTFGIAPFAAVGGYTYALATTLLFTGLAAAGTLRRRWRTARSVDRPPEAPGSNRRRDGRR